MHHRDRTSYQYALLNLAILQADFGCFSEAIVAMQEAITTAREHDDMGCLNYSLSWLYHFGKEHPGEIGEVQRSGVLGTEREALAFLKAKAKETNMWSLLSTTLLSEARLALTSVRDCPIFSLDDAHALWDLFRERASPWLSRASRNRRISILRNMYPT